MINKVANIFVGVFLLILLFVVSSFSQPAFVSETSWTVDIYGDYGTRGLAYDGSHYYVGNWKQKCVYIFDNDGNLLDTIVNGSTYYFGHGVATDGTSLWVSGYFDRTIYQYDLSTRSLVNSFSIPMAGNPHRMDFDGNSLWITVYDTYKVFEVSTDGVLLSSFDIDELPGDNIALALAGNNEIWISSIVRPTSPAVLCKYKLDGTLVEKYEFPESELFMVLATNINDRTGGIYLDIADGLIRHFVEKQDIEIDIKPGSYPNSINLGSNGKVPVAILGSADFDATTVDPYSVTLGGAEVVLKGKSQTPMASVEDVNEDGFDDLVVHVDTEALELSEEDTTAILEGETNGGMFIIGEDTIRVVP